MAALCFICAALGVWTAVFVPNPKSPPVFCKDWDQCNRRILVLSAFLTLDGLTIMLLR